MKSNNTRCLGERELVFQNVIPHPLIANDGRGRRALWLRPTRGDALTSPPPPLVTPPEAEKRRTIITGTGSQATAEDRVLPRGTEVPPPVRHKAFTLSEKEDSLSEAPRRVSYDEEPLIEMTSKSIMGCSIEPLESLSPMPMVNQEDMIRENEYLED